MLERTPAVPAALGPLAPAATIRAHVLSIYRSLVAELMLCEKAGAVLVLVWCYVVGERGS